MCERNIARIGAKSFFVGIEFHSPETTRISQSQCAATIEVHNKSFPRGIFAMTRILKAIDRINTVKLQHASHPEAQPKRRSIITGVEQ
ncbi:unannotated protein [freshwater metagenome]|uniref:Unannotated protein n=1 Tax=freshwater metagenome TaxID=449393 RepID=A0A6J6HE81_9ZZZZ